VAGSRSSSVDEAHHLGVAVESDQVVDVVHGEAAQDQPLGLQEDVHAAMLRMKNRAAVGVR
jgi:hypothetical protein